MGEKSDNRAGRPAAKAVADLRRFLKARWEEGDPKLFTVRTPAKRTAEAQRPETAKNQPGAVNSTPSQPPAPPLVRQPANSYAPPAMARRLPATTAAGQAAQPPTRHPSGILPRKDSARERELMSFYEKIKACENCPLARTRTNFVFGFGNPEASIMFVGEAPGEQEDKQGIPFIGPAGHLLDRLLAGAGIRRDDVFIANVLKCRPPGNRKPAEDEIAACDPHLAGQVRIVAPKILVALGTFAAQSLLRSAKPIGQIRGRWYRIGEIDFLATYHPSAGLRSGDFLRVIEADLKTLKEKIDSMTAKPAG
jgi:DNA polymerase